MGPCPYCHTNDACKPGCDRGDLEELVCEDCGERVHELHDACQDQFDADLCGGCFDNRVEAAWERQQEALMSEPPLSLDEQHRRAWQLHRELHR